jgi:hypothetical protein
MLLFGKLWPYWHTFDQAERLARDKQYCLLGPPISYKENEEREIEKEREREREREREIFYEGRLFSNTFYVYARFLLICRYVVTLEESIIAQITGPIL